MCVKEREFNQEEFENFILENKVIGFFEKPILLKSGRLSPYYINWRNVTEDVFLTDKLSDYVISFVKKKGISPDCFYGVPEGATKLAIITQYKYAKLSPHYGPGSYVLCMGRKQPKDHGEPKDKYFLGAPRGKVIVLEDVLTTGSSIFSAIESLKKIKVEILGVLVLTNRMEKTNEGENPVKMITSQGISFFQMTDSLRLFKKAFEKFQPNSETIEKIKEYFKKYGISPL